MQGSSPSCCSPFCQFGSLHSAVGCIRSFLQHCVASSQHMLPCMNRHLPILRLCGVTILGGCPPTLESGRHPDHIGSFLRRGVAPYNGWPRRAVQWMASCQSKSLHALCNMCCLVRWMANCQSESLHRRTPATMSVVTSASLDQRTPATMSSRHAPCIAQFDGLPSIQESGSEGRRHVVTLRM